MFSHQNIFWNPRLIMKKFPKFSCIALAVFCLIVLSGCDTGPKNLGGPVLIGQVPLRTHGHLGVGFAPGRDGLPRVIGVIPNSPAVIAGLAVGDTIDSIDGRTIENFAELKSALENTKPDDFVRLSITRNGDPIELTFRLMSAL